MATYYVDGATGDDADTGGAGDPWATIQKAMDTVAAGDDVWVKASADYTEDAALVTNGTRASPIKFRGYTSTTGDDGQATIDGASTRANGFSMGGSTPRYYLIENFIVKNTTGVAFEGGRGICYRNCDAQSPGSHGFTGTNQKYDACKVSSAGDSGISSSGDCIAAFCDMRGCATNGMAFSDGLAYGCIVVSAGNYGIAIGSTQNLLQGAIACTIDGDGKDTVEGIQLNSFTSEYAVIVANCCVYDCGTGIRILDDQDELIVSRCNLLNNNTSNYTNWETTHGEQTGAPAFEDEAGGDYNPGSSSPLKNNGADAGEIDDEYGSGTRTTDIGGFQVSATCDYPAVGDVQDGVTFDSGGQTGTLELPAVGDVEDGVGFGAGGTEFTGTLELPTAAQVEEGVGFGAGGTEFTGSFVAPPGGPGLAYRGNLF